MRALLFSPRFVAPSLAGEKTETRRVPKCVVCRRTQLLVIDGVAGKVECEHCHALQKVRWRVKDCERVQGVTRPLFAKPPRCPRCDARMEALRVDRRIVGYGCPSRLCGHRQPAADFLFSGKAPRVEQLGALTEEAARRDGLCSRAEFFELIARINGVRLGRHHAVEVYEYRDVAAPVLPAVVTSERAAEPCTQQ